MIRRALDRGYLLAALVLGLYAWVAPTTIVGGDNPEFAALSVLGGRAHPSGYPLYVLYLRATSWLPGVSAAHTAALATCLLGALAVLAVHAAARAWGARPPAATLAAAMFAASPLAMMLHSEAEVFALNALVVALILWLAATDGPLRGERRVIALAAVAGLGLCNHLSCALVAPIGLYGAALGVRESARRAPVVIAMGLGAFVAGLTPYIYVAIAPDTSVSWGHSRSLDDVIGHVLRRDYGASSLSARGGDTHALDSEVSLARTLARAWWWLPLAVGLGTLGWRAARPAATRGSWIALAASWLLAGPLFASRFNIPPEGAGQYILQRMHLLPALLLAVPVAVGLDTLAARVRIAASAAGSALALAALLLFAAPSLSAVQASHSPAVERGLVNTLRALPAGSAMITDGDDYMFGVPYAQDVLGIRRDVIEIQWGTFGFRWALDRLRARGVDFKPFVPGVTELASVRLADQLNATGHPVFVDDFEGHIINARPHFPYAGMTRILPPGTAVPSIDEIFTYNARAFSGFDLDYPLPGPDDAFMAIAHVRDAETWFRIADMAKRAHRDDLAADARGRAMAISPQR